MIARLLMTLLCAWTLAGCGDGKICFGGNCGNDNNDDDEDTVTVQGNVDSVAPPNAVRDLVSFVYSGLDPQDLADGPPFDNFRAADSDLVAEDGDTFSMDRVRRGDLTVIFLLDASEPDGVIDPGDECSVLLDGGDLNDVGGGRRVDIQDIDIDFRESSCPGGVPIATGCGCARADDIRVILEPAGSPTNEDG